MGNVLLYFDTLLALCALAGLCVYYHSAHPSQRRILALGLCMGAATLFKQHAWLAVALAGLWLLRHGWRTALLYTLGALDPARPAMERPAGGGTVGRLLALELGIQSRRLHGRRCAGWRFSA